MDHEIVTELSEEGRPCDLPEAVGHRGMLRRVNHGADLVIDERMTAERLRAEAGRCHQPAWVLSEWLAELAHLGDVGTVMAAWVGYHGYPALVLMRFADGCEFALYTTEVHFD